jgi:hypothetical protein
VNCMNIRGAEIARAVYVILCIFILHMSVHLVARRRVPGIAFKAGTVHLDIFPWILP